MALLDGVLLWQLYFSVSSQRIPRHEKFYNKSNTLVPLPHTAPVTLLLVTGVARAAGVRIVGRQGDVRGDGFPSRFSYVFDRLHSRGLRTVRPYSSR